MKRLYITILLILISIISFCQEDLYYNVSQNTFCELIEIVDVNKDIINNTKDIIYFGLDFSYLGLVNPEKLGQEKKIKHVYCPAWIKYFHNKIKPEKIHKKYIKNKNVVFDSVSVQLRYKLLDEDNFIKIEDYDFPIDTLISIIKSYNLPQESGIGLVIVPISFNKERIKSYSYITFFDIESKELLYTVKMSCVASGAGLTGLYTRGLVSNFKAFFKEVYKMEFE